MLEMLDSVLLFKCLILDIFNCLNIQLLKCSTVEIFAVFVSPAVRSAEREEEDVAAEHVVLNLVWWVGGRFEQVGWER